MTLHCKKAFCKKHPLITCTELLLAQLCLEALEKAPLTTQSHIAAWIKELNILVSKHDDYADSMNHAAFF